MRALLVACMLAASCTQAPPYDGANRVFVTSTVHTGNFGGVAGGDAICAQRAAEAGLDGTFLAWLGTTTSSPFTRFQSSRGWVLVDGTPVADRLDDFVTRSAFQPIHLDEHGRDARPTQWAMWTASNPDGTAYALATCADWTSDANAMTGVRGSDRAGGSLMLFTEGAPCDSTSRLLCLEVGRSVPITLVPATGRHAFLTASYWLPSGGLAAADQQCMTEAAAAQLAGAYKAVLSTTTATAASRFDLNGPPWVRGDGFPLAKTARELFSAQLLDTFLDRTADGTRVTDALHWGRDPNDVISTETCADWTSASAGATAGGDGFRSDHAGFYVYDYISCGSPMERLLCLED